jgi:hypothetical protein
LSCAATPDARKQIAAWAVDVVERIELFAYHG